MIKCRITDNLQIFGVYIASCMKRVHVEEYLQTIGRWPVLGTLQTNPILLSLLFSFIYPTVSSGTQSIHSHAAKIEIITQKILEMNNRGGDSRINEGKEEAEENKSWM